MLKQRIITAVILTVIFISSIVFYWVGILFAVFLGAAVYELSMLTLKPGNAMSIILGLVYGLLFWWVGADIENSVIYYQSIIGMLLWVGIFLYMLIYRFSGQLSIVIRSFYFLLGMTLLWICVHALLFLYLSFDQGGWMMLFLLTLVWVADIGAYFSGRRFGKNKLAPGISPGKTWEGVAGGVLANLLWMLLVYKLTEGWGMTLGWFVSVGLATSAISVVGDLFESILKREAGVKDSGKILPGHGGVLDRVDSVIAAAPIFVSGLFFAGVA
ncbi:MAG: phosphatidate cytidylyltransferase [Gammaproteobacteria bacterium]|nr:phosphatidate cytidylyltransferase [Gammaproteobacteria bacterium]